MTAEVVIMNKNAVAMAADSAATRSLFTGRSKISNSANKLFRLSKCSPVGLLIYNNSRINKLAQRDVVDTFLTGINSSIDNKLSDLVDDFCKNIVKSERTDEQKNLGIELTKSIKEGLLNCIRAERESNSGDIIDIVSDLSISDLSQMAKNLVEMTSFKRKVTSDMETVGGPIDVAVISKGDGFIWIDRKHYFKKELNEHFFEHYSER